MKSSTVATTSFVNSVDTAMFYCPYIPITINFQLENERFLKFLDGIFNDESYVELMKELYSDEVIKHEILKKIFSISEMFAGKNVTKFSDLSEDKQVSLKLRFQ